MKKYLLAVGLTFFGALSACTPVTYTEVLVDPSPPVVYRTAPSIYVAPYYGIVL